MKEDLKPSIVFSSITVFDNLRIQCSYIVWIANRLIVGKVSLDRINDFLVEVCHASFLSKESSLAYTIQSLQTELLDSFDPTPNPYTPQTTIRNLNVPHENEHEHEHEPSDDEAEHPNPIGIHEALFTWSSEVNKTYTASSERRFVLAVDQETLAFKKGGFNLIVGPTGSGKTSLLMALLGEFPFSQVEGGSHDANFFYVLVVGEMHYIPVAKDSYVHLPREGGIAYAAQESWVQNETIRVRASVSLSGFFFRLPSLTTNVSLPTPPYRKT